MRCSVERYVASSDLMPLVEATMSEWLKSPYGASSLLQQITEQLVGLAVVALVDRWLKDLG